MADVIKSIGSGKDYSTVNSWYVNWLNTGSSFLGDNEIGQTYGSITETSQTVINTGKTTASKRIYLESAPSERHNGKYDETKAYIYHNFDLGTAKGLIEIEESYVEIRFLQFKHDSAFYRNVSIGNTFSSLVESSIHHNIVKYVGSPASSQVRGIFAQSAGIYRNIVFDFRSAADESKARGIWVWEATGTGLIYQNTVINCGAGFDCNNASGITIKQNYAGDCVVDYQSITGITSSKNISSDSSSPDGASYRGKNSYTDYFVDYNNDDFHLKSTDTVLKDAGDNLGSPYDVDIDGESVTGTWDIGADEYVAGGTPSPLPMAMNHYRRMRM